jgi:hypothetical protein
MGASSLSGGGGGMFSRDFKKPNETYSI